MDKYILFSTYIHSDNLSDMDSETDQLIERIYEEREKDPKGIRRSNAKNTDAWHSHTNINEWDETEFLVDHLVNCMYTIFDQTRYDPDSSPKLHNMWANISPTHGFNKAHIHSGCLWSGVYYLQTPNKCGDITFIDPRYSRSMLTPKLDKGEPEWSESSTYTFSPRKCLLLLFPSYLMHEVQPNASKKDRISISFNFGQQFE